MTALMPLHMRTSFDLPDALLARARALAAERNKSLRDLVEEGLIRVLEESEASPSFALPDLSFGGEGMEPEVAAGGWDAVRARAYEERGG